MYSFIPQFLILISIVGIIIIVLRKSPGIIIFFKRTPILKIPARGTVLLGKKLWASLRNASRKFWGFVLEVKDLSKNKALPSFSKTISKISFPKNVKLPSFTLPAATSLTIKKAEKSMEAGDYEGAERMFIELIQKDPKSEAAYVGLAKLYFTQKKYQEAIETYEFLIRYHPQNDLYHAGLAHVYSSAKIYDQAIEAYEKAIVLAPDNPKRYINLGLVLEERDHLGEAILNYRKATDLDKQNVQFLMILAKALTKNNQAEDAENILEKVLEVEPTNSEAREKLMKLKF